MAHGAGGTASRRLVEGLIGPLLLGPQTFNDAAVVQVEATRMAITTDSFVVRPLTFPGGSIGTLAVYGTVNDLAVSGALPVALVVSLVIEAGLERSVLEDELRAMAASARLVGVPLVGGDTKVVEHGKADGLYVTTTGIGRLDNRLMCDASRVRPGDRVLLTGCLGDHGITVLLARGDLDLEAEVLSDSRSVLPFTDALARTAGHGVRWMRDPTRGGAASALNELARDTGFCIQLQEGAIPVRNEVRGACELLGLDPLHIANEGQVIAIVAPDTARAALEALRGVPGGEHASIIGDVQEAPARTVLATSPYGGTRVVDMLTGDPLPRIC
ncbi:MAG: hydrogenase expression/formation protein HypE [Vicinamibacterales bacterium]